MCVAKVYGDRKMVRAGGDMAVQLGEHKVCANFIHSILGYFCSTQCVDIELLIPSRNKTSMVHPL